MKNLKKRWELDGKLLENGDKVYVEYNPREHLYLKEIFMYRDGTLINEEGFKLEVDSAYVDKMELSN